MNEGFTGFNPELVKKECQYFLSVGDRALTFFLQAYNSFYDVLKIAWCSPKAVDFTSHLKNYMTSLHHLEAAYVNVARSAERAYNINAVANGCQPIPDDQMITAMPYSTGGMYTNYVENGTDLSEVNENGVVGMNKMLVKTALDLFNKKINEGCRIIDDTPYSIAFFDEDGSQKQAFKAEITKMKDELVQEVLGILQSIDEAIETEVNTMELAKQQATQTLNG